jgi:uncharacterized coiled-coil protein SlyX
MNTDKRIVELLSDMLLEQKKTNEKLGNVDGRLSSLEIKFDRLEKRLESVEKQQAKTNLAIGELRLSILKFAEKINHQSQLEKRVTKLEKVIFKN